MSKTINRHICLSVTDCKRLGYFVPNELKTGSIVWNRGGEKIGSIGFGTNMTGVPVAMLLYTFDGRTVETVIPLRFHPCNLNTAEAAESGYYYFVCPETGRSCRKLYLNESGDFVSRHALKALYDKQAASKSKRTGFYGYFSIADAIDQEYSHKYRRFTYNGKLTRHGRKVENLEKRLERFDTSFAYPITI